MRKNKISKQINNYFLLQQLIRYNSHVRVYLLHNPKIIDNIVIIIVLYLYVIRKHTIYKIYSLILIIIKIVIHIQVIQQKKRSLP